MPSPTGTSAAFFRCKLEAQLLRSGGAVQLDFLPRHDEQTPIGAGKWKLANGLTRFQNGGSCHINRLRLRLAPKRAHQGLRIPAEGPRSRAKFNAFGS